MIKFKKNWEGEIIINNIEMISKLKKMLNEAKIPFDIVEYDYRGFGGQYISLIGINDFNTGEKICSCSNCDFDLKNDELRIDNAMTEIEFNSYKKDYIFLKDVEEIFKRLKYCYDNQTVIYVDEKDTKEKLYIYKYTISNPKNKFNMYRYECEKRYDNYWDMNFYEIKGDDIHFRLEKIYENVVEKITNMAMWSLDPNKKDYFKQEVIKIKKTKIGEFKERIAKYENDIKEIENV